MTFHGLVEFVRYEEQTKKNSKGGLPVKTVWIVVRDISTKRTHWISDWSGGLENAKTMESCKGNTLEVQGFVNAIGKIHFAVLERWGVWHEAERLSTNPITKEHGLVHLENKAKDKKKSTKKEAS